MSTASGHLAGSDQIGEHWKRSVPDWRADRGLLPPSWLPTLIVAAVATPTHQTNLEDPEWDFALPPVGSPRFLGLRSGSSQKS